MAVSCKEEKYLNSRYLFKLLQFLYQQLVKTDGKKISLNTAVDGDQFPLPMNFSVTAALQCCSA